MDLLIVKVTVINMTRPPYLLNFSLTVRANAFHYNSNGGLVRFIHFGNRSVSLEESGGPSTFVIKTHALEETDRAKVKEALCYLAPEQTGSVENIAEDHRTDLYSLGIFFWTLVVGRGTSPFEGGPLQLLHAIAQKRPMPVHEIRRDVPQVLAAIIEKVMEMFPFGFSALISILAPFQEPGGTVSECVGH